MIMAMEWIEKITGSLEQKKRYREYKARKEQLPENYRAAIEALDRYFMYFGGITKGDTLVAMVEDLASLFEESAANGTPIRAIVGEDPVEFAETFLQNYEDGRWINKERRRLVETIDRIAGDEARVIR
jgi:DNA-binding ferritin-like protein (Dps family)